MHSYFYAISDLKNEAAVCDCVDFAEMLDTLFAGGSTDKK